MVRGRPQEAGPPRDSSTGSWPMTVKRGQTQTSAPRTHPSPMAQPTVISTFAGCGGSSIGYRLAGFRELLAVEFWDKACEAFRANFPDVPLWDQDITDLSVEQALDLAGVKPGELTVFDGSPPCQGFSTAGKRRFDDGRNQLFKQYVRLLEGIQPQAFVMENVAGMVKGIMKLTFVEILEALKETGYRVRCWRLDAAHYGVPQTRNRLIFIGYRDDLGIDPTCPPASPGRPITCSQALRDIDDPGHPITSKAVMKLACQMKPGELGKKYHPQGHFFGLWRLDPNKPAQCIIRSGGNQSIIHWGRNRFIGAPSLARLFSFPDDYVWPDPRTSAVKNLLGNCVPPNMMRAIATHVVGCLKGTQ